LRIVMDSLLRLPLESKMVRSVSVGQVTDPPATQQTGHVGDLPHGDLVVVTTSASSPERRKILEARGIRVLVFDGPGGRPDLPSIVDWLGRQQYLSLMIEAGSKVNWTALESGCVDRIFFYYGTKILGGLEALPLAGGIGRRRRSDAIRIHGITIHPIPPDEFAVEGYVDVHWDH
jgi:diaminohydroxyphosphoribosylaminopyrimidine deaminase/5-amino-6-(5-phosphoribosylamino)uracil reductase